MGYVTQEEVVNFLNKICANNKELAEICITKSYFNRELNYPTPYVKDNCVSMISLLNSLFIDKYAHDYKPILAIEKTTEDGIVFKLLDDIVKK